MSIRVTQNVMYNNMVGSMQSSLGSYMESIQQGSSQKQINRPSDDPAGTYRVLTTRNDIAATEQYQENVDTAKGWLKLADSILSSNVSTLLTDLKALAEQASTGTYTAEQRMIMADQARQYFGQLLNLSNTQFEDMHIFAGHKTNAPAFQQGLATTTWDDNWSTAVHEGNVEVIGSAERTVMVRFPESGELSEDTKFQYSTDGGANWVDATVKAADEKGEPPFTLDMGGLSMTVDKPVTVTAYNPGEETGAKNGTMLYIRPAAFYQGDDNDPAIDVSLMGAGEITNTRDSDDNPIHATGTFGKNILVRIDGARNSDGQYAADVDLFEKGQEFQWSYSTDGGANWITARGTSTGDGTLRLPVPGGYIDYDLRYIDEQDGGNATLSPAADTNGGKLLAGMQANIHPSRADVNYEIMKDTYLAVSSVGKDVFGGYYEGKPAMSDSEENLFEVLGEFIGYLETNNQEGCQKTLAALSKAEKKVLAEATRIGGMENRLEMAADVLSFQKIDQKERLSYTEDIDLTELLTKLTRQQLTYQTVLQSSSMIMKLSLANYV